MGNSTKAFDQAKVTPANDLPNPYRTIENWAQFPDGRKGAIGSVALDRDGSSIWVLERCNSNSCVADPTTGKMSCMDPILHFDASGKLINSFGAGLIAGPHRIHIDFDGNVWVTDFQDNAPRPGEPGVGDAGGVPGRRSTGVPEPGATIGHQVLKFTPQGKLLMTVGRPGGALEGEADPGYFYQPCDVMVLPNGEFFVGLGHGQGKPEVLKFSKDGELIKRWGELGTGPGQFDQAHSFAMDSKGRLFVGDRNNNRIQIFDQDGNYLSEMNQFSRPSGIFIDKDDNLYEADSESDSVSDNNYGWNRGIRIGSLKDGVPRYFIPDPDAKTKSRAKDGFTGTWAAEGIIVDAAGNIFGAEVGNRRLMKYELIKK